jgi:hypothetical protein
MRCTEMFVFTPYDKTTADTGTMRSISNGDPGIFEERPTTSQHVSRYRVFNTIDASQEDDILDVTESRDTNKSHVAALGPNCSISRGKADNAGGTRNVSKTALEIRCCGDHGAGNTVPAVRAVKLVSRVEITVPFKHLARDVG